jgi:DNA invertase Pin-like site-specific DNA recombinase
MVNVLGSVAQFEREMMLELEREGIAKAAAAGKCKCKGKRRTFSDERLQDLQAEGLSIT